MASWRALEEYSPFARTLVEYMWTQRPPLVPNQFAERMGVRKQALSTWLNSDAVPAPPVVVRLARRMGRPVRELMTAAGYAPADDPLLDIVDAWAYVRGEVEQVGSGSGSGELAAATPAAREALLALLHQLQDRAVGRPRAAVLFAGDGAGAPHDPRAVAALGAPGAPGAPSAQDGRADTAGAPAGADPDA
jgi:transcriptional regulator with XRE-family HTH domain